MAPLSREDAPPYVREEVVEELTKFYLFLVGTHIPAEALRRAPPGGWPHLTHGRLQCMGKSEAVYDLIRHIPYIQHETRGQPFQIYEDCVPLDYTGWAAQGDNKREWRLHSEHEALLGDHVQPHQFMLGYDPNGDSGYRILFDCEDGTFRLEDYIVRSQECFKPREFFTMLRERYRTLAIYPVRSGVVRGKSRTADVYWDTAKLIFRKHGWMTQAYHKETCLVEIQALNTLYLKEGAETVLALKHSLLLPGVVAEVTSYYEFLTELYLPDGIVMQPPPDGWPHLTADTLAFLGKRTAVVQLLRSLPYLRHEENLEEYRIFDSCVPIDYTSPDTRRCIHDQMKPAFEPIPEAMTLGPSQIMLAYPRPGTRGYHLVFDTEANEFHLAPVCSNKSIFGEAHEFFSTLKERFRQLDVFPIAPWEIEVSRSRRFPQMREHFLRYGWMSDSYRKDECIRLAPILWYHLGGEGKYCTKTCPWCSRVMGN